MSNRGDWRRPDWLIDAMRAGSSGIVPPSLTQAMKPMADLFGFSPALAGKELIDAAAARLVGRPLTIRAGDAEVGLVLRLLKFERPPIGLMVGQLGDVVVEAEDVTVGDLRIDHLRLDVRNLHLQAGAPSGDVVAAPVKVRVAIAQDVVTDVITRRSTRVEIELREGGVARASLAGRKGWGHVDVVPRIDGRTLVLSPRSIAVRARQLLSGARWLPPLRLGLPTSFPEAHVTDVTVEDGHLMITGVYEEWRWPLGPKTLDELLGQIKRFDGGVLSIPTA